MFAGWKLGKPTLGQSTYSQTGPGIEHSDSNHTYPPLPDSSASSTPFGQTGPGLPGQFPNQMIHGNPSCPHAHSEPPSYPSQHYSSPAPCENPSKALPPEEHRSGLTIRVPSLAKRGGRESSEAAEDAGSEALVQKILTDPHGYESEPGLDRRMGGGGGRQREKRQGMRALNRVLSQDNPLSKITTSQGARNLTRVISQDDTCSKSRIVQLQAQLEGARQKQSQTEAELQKVTAEAGIATAKAAASVESSKEGELQERIAQEAHEKRLQELEYVAAQTREEAERSKEEALQEWVAREAREKRLQELELVVAQMTEEAERSKEEARKEQVAREAREKQLRELESALAVARTNQDRSGMGVGEAPVDPALSPLHSSGGGAGEPGPTVRRGREDVDMAGGEAQERSLGAESSAVELQLGTIQLDEDVKMAGDEHKHDVDNEGGGSAKPRTLELRINRSMKMKGKGIVGGRKSRAGGGPHLYLLSEPASTPRHATPPHLPIQPASMPNDINRLSSLRTPSNSPFHQMPNAATSPLAVNLFQRASPSDEVMQPANDPQVDQKPTVEGNRLAFPVSRCGNDSNGAPDSHGDAQPPSATQTLDMHAIAAQLESMKAMWAMNTQLIMELQQEYAGRRPSH
ncbi:hypothetical protein ARMGADRAFT_1091752 [Armillaria gallica]|uniref:Uncharacterized protein n=1 Tax=Armillaria gallica TaxID=47427 RepID=A0A2H3CD35_ARMGA|nr:hypothetical protein ARMGADRAFT_1091752 [Armillaria gallica]